MKNNKAKNVLELAVGSTAEVHWFDGDLIAGKFLSMGILPGKIIRKIRQAPFGGACYIRVENRNIALRNKEAACILLRQKSSDNE